MPAGRSAPATTGPGSATSTWSRCSARRCPAARRDRLRHAAPGASARPSCIARTCRGRDIGRVGASTSTGRTSGCSAARSAASPGPSCISSASPSTGRRRPTWSRPLSRAALAEAARVELRGYWTGAVRRVPGVAHRSARRPGPHHGLPGRRHDRRQGRLITKREAIDRLPSLGVPAQLDRRDPATAGGGAGGAVRAGDPGPGRAGAPDHARAAGPPASAGVGRREQSGRLQLGRLLQPA